MTAESQNYFTCTLGEAAKETSSPSFHTIDQLLLSQAERNGDRPAVGFYQILDPKTKVVTAECLTFRELLVGIEFTEDVISQTLEGLNDRNHGEGRTIGILMQSSPEFLFIWLALIRLGCSVLLLAPQLSPAAIAHLCRTCKVDTLLTDHQSSELASRACCASPEVEGAEKLVSIRSSLDLNALLKHVASHTSVAKFEPGRVGDGVAYIHHTSGTSSGLPKPIPQTHHGAVGVVPVLDGMRAATFTTTPLYHGGPADIFRAWASIALIWLFPSHAMPVTASNVCKCFEASLKWPQPSSPPIKYFTSVPYVLQMMAEDDTGIGILKGMNLVGVGGAALSPLVGNDLVLKGVNLVSRFGSAECGFLLSSHRDYRTDKEWQFLRHSSNSTGISFEAREDGLYELIVGPNWPHLAKCNRDDGSFATSDLFERHETIKNAWRYHSRSDSQITLVTGKKFDPTPIEHDLVAASNDVMDVLVFGEGESYPGVLVFPTRALQATFEEALVRLLMPSIRAINDKSPKHARIPDNMVCVMPFKGDPLEKSSKGSIMRQRANDKHAVAIQRAYEAATHEGSVDVSDKNLAKSVKSIVVNCLGCRNVDSDQDLFAQGVDSIMSMQIRRRLLSLLPNDTDGLSSTIVQDAVNIDGIVAAILSIRHPDREESIEPGDEWKMVEYMEEFSQLDQGRPVESMIDGWVTVVEPPGKTILMTGATGSLGSFVLNELVQNPEISLIYVLVRGATQKSAEERVKKALTSRKLPVTGAFFDKVTILQCDLSEPGLGIPFADYSELQSSVDVILHLAWSVNFLIALQSFRPHFQGIQNLLQLCLSSTSLKPPRFVFCSSVAAVSGMRKSSSEQTHVPEAFVPVLDSCGHTGYAKSKLTAELILARAAQNVKSLKGRISAIRVGQLSADTSHGVWNASEAYPQILATAKLNDGRLPDLGKIEYLSWVPVDVAAKAFVEGSLIEPKNLRQWPTEHAFHRNGYEQTSIACLKTTQGFELSVDTSTAAVLHLLNPDVKHTFTDFLRVIQEVADSRKEDFGKIKIVQVADWLRSLEMILADDTASENARRLLRLLPFWRQAYGPDRLGTMARSEAQECSYDMHQSLLAMPSLSYWLGLSTAEGCTNADQNQLLRPEYVQKALEWTWTNVV